MLSLLIVDDEPTIVDTLAFTIDWEKLEIMTVYKAYTAKEALSILSEHAVDIVIADINMPRMTGIELVAQIYKQYRHVKSVLLSGYAEFAYAKQAINYSVSDYLLKPLSDDDLIAVIRKLVQQIKEEWQEVVSRRRVVHTLKESLPVLKDKLLNELLMNRVKEEDLLHLLELYDLPFQLEDEICVMVIRMEESLPEFNDRDFFLLEYAVINIAVEMLGDSYDLWSCKDANDCLVLVARKKSVRNEDGIGEEPKKFDSLAMQLQRNIGLYLKRVVSIIVSKWGRFPGDINMLYSHMTEQIRSRLANESGCFLSSELSEEVFVQQPLHRMYETPTLHHLLENRRWDEYRDKLETVIQDMKQARSLSSEHVQEAYTLVAGSFYYYAHKHNRLLSDLVGGTSVLGRVVHSVQQLSEWAHYMLEKIQYSDQAEKRSSKDKLTLKIREYIDRNLSTASLQTIADAVYLHPVYLSRLYKDKTGEGVSEYIHKQRMVKAAEMLKDDSLKIYAISEQLGFKNAAYFSKVFREEFGMTPNEFREQL
ncbi:response regulator [Paenibacillus harenae]|uniref:Two-component system response regulator YesN n=1 Tax=Paenibacillus harenae TaxID=306543 RepID=A0ABT9UAG1_PAEHA|nr:response regulator [Paenibacillus harenae]MDQ0116617.1 two-component system response regulator YesN [Paenibacillus harenae]